MPAPRRLEANEKSAPYALDQQHETRMQVMAALYVDAGCKPGSYQAIADQIGISYNAVALAFRRPKMLAYIRHLLTQRFNQLELSSERVMQELATIAFHNVRDVYDENGDLYEPYMLPDHVAAAVSGLEIEKRTEIRGRRSARTEDDPDGMENGDVGIEEVVTKKYKFHSKVDALKTLAQHFKIIGGVDEGVNALASALADKLKAARRRIEPEQPIEDARTIDTPQPAPPQEISDEEPIW